MNCRRISGIVWSWTIPASVSMAKSIFRALTLSWRASLFYFVLWTADCSIDFVPNFIHCLAAIELSFHNFVSLQEPLEFRRQFVVLRRYQIHMLVQSVNFGLPAIWFTDLLLILLLKRVQLVLELTKFAGSRLETHFAVSLANLELLGTAYFILVGFCQLGLGLLVPSILLFIVADLIVKLFQIVLECNNFVLSCPNWVFEAENVFIPLVFHFALVPDSILSCLNLSLQALHGVLGRLIWIIFGLAAFPEFSNLVCLFQVRLLIFS